MAEGKPLYRKLSGRRRGIGGFSQLWLGPGHILVVESSRFVEHYRRFELADIQAIVITEGPDWSAWQTVALAVSIAWTLALFSMSSLAAKALVGGSGAIALAFAIADIARGPRCRCHLYTAVTRELLAPVSRVRVARRFLELVRPAIESVQGTLSPEQASAVEPDLSPAAREAPPEIAREPGYLPEILFGLFLVNAAFVLLMKRFPASQLDNYLPTTFFGEFVILVVALVRRPGRDPRRFVYALMFVALGFMAWDAVGLGRSFVRYMAAVMEQSRHGKSAPPTLASWLAFDTTPAMLAAGWRTVAGIAGLIAAWVERKAS